MKKNRFLKGPKKKPYTPKYRKEWEKDIDLKKWLTSSEKSNYYCHCKFCFDDYLGGISAVRKHSQSEKHKKNASSVSTRIDHLPLVLKVKDNKFKTKEAELRIAMFIVEHNIALRTSDHLVQLIKHINPESEIVQNIFSNRTKSIMLVNNVIGSCAFDDLISRMKTNCFSILIDESTDKSAIKHLAIVVRMMAKDQFIIKDEFGSLSEISNATAQSVFDAIMKFFKDNDIPYKNNLIGFGSDGAKVMFGSKHSVKTLLEKEIPGLFVLKCVCHSMALCASYAAEKIPNSVEDMVRDIYTYMKMSFKRQTEYKEFQVFVETKPHKILQVCQTRWL